MAAAEGTPGTPPGTPPVPPPPVPPPVSPVSPPVPPLSPVSPPVSPPVPLLDCSGDDAQAMGWEPLPILRQILAACTFPDLLESPELPEAVRDRARKILQELDAENIGGYNHEHRSRGVPARIAQFLERRDGVPCDPRDIVLCNGTASIIPFVLSLLWRPPPCPPVGVLVPVPGPPLCAAAAAMAGAVPVPYPLLQPRPRAPLGAALRRALRAARGRGRGRGRCRPEVLWVLNPGDPTGHVLSRRAMRSLVRLAAEESLLLLADEVHQERAFDPERPFVSFRRLLAELGPPLRTRVQLVSLYSLSHCACAEGGARAGFLHLENIEPGVLRGFYTWGLSVYPPIPGMVMLDAAMEVPGAGDPAGNIMEEHRSRLCHSLATNARLLSLSLSRCPGIRCHPPAGGPRALLQLRIPPRARSRAREFSLPSDAFLCRELREATGLRVTPGSHFGMGGDSGHLGLSLLLPPPALERALLLLRRFHQQFLREFS